MKGDKIVVPKSLQAEYVRKLHNGRLDAESCKRRARDILFWPRMSQDIENFVKMCAVSNSCKSHQQKEPLMMHDVPSRPWSIVATDLYQWNGNNCLVTVDSYSGWYEIDLLGSNSSIAVIKKLKKSFPQIWYSRFKMFVEEWNFRHLTSSPEYAQSNGLAENAVKAAKTLMEKSYRDGSDAYLALLNNRNTPRDSILESPAQRLMSRRTKSVIPIVEAADYYV